MAPIAGLPLIKKEAKPQKSQAQISCEAKGRTWDAVSKTCIKEEVPPLSTPETFTDVKTGELSGITIDGKTFFGTPQQINEIAANKLAKTQQPAGTVPVGTAQALAEQQQQQKVLQETEQPERRELDPFRTGAEKIPVVGGVIGALADVIRPFKKSLGFKTQELSVLQPEELRTLALTAIDKQEVERGLTASETFGKFVEAIPIVGSLASKYAGGLIETPSENTQTILKELKTEKTRATNAEIKVKDGTLSPQAGQEIINDIDLNIQRMESRIRLLIANSPELSFNSDGVNFIETKILEARERLFNAKINMISGASQDPSDIAILQALKGNIEAEDFEIPNR